MALDEHGGKQTLGGLARRLDLPALRIGGVVSVARRLLNVDGYAVLEVDEESDTVTLNRALLVKQFELEGW